MTTALLHEVGRGEVRTRRTIRGVPLTPEEVGARIVRAREERTPKPWSQFDLALALGVSPSTIYRWEKGRLPSMGELIRLAELLDVPLEEFTEPPERRVDLTDLRSAVDALDHRLEGIEAGLSASREAVLEILAAIHDLLVLIRESQVRPDAQAK